MHMLQFIDDFADYNRISGLDTDLIVDNFLLRSRSVSRLTADDPEQEPALDTFRTLYAQTFAGMWDHL